MGKHGDHFHQNSSYVAIWWPWNTLLAIVTGVYGIVSNETPKDTILDFRHTLLRGS